MAKKNKSIEHEHIFTRFTKEQLALLSRDELIAVCLGAQDINLQLIKDFDAAKNKQIEIKESYLRLVEKLFKPSIKVIKPVKLPPKKKPSSRRPKGTLRERYPNLEVKETPVEMSPLCKCANCNVFMTDSGMTEDAEVLRVVPRKYYIELVKRHKYRCILCHGTILTAPAPAKIMPGSIYHDEVILYWVLSKYADYMPIGRQASIAHLEGFNFPANSMLETTHYLSAFVEVAYDLCKVEVCSEKNLKADESPLRMLEGSERMSWYLWAFMGRYTVYYEAHDTRAGAICSSVILDSECESLLTDVFSRYKKSLREVSVARKKVGRPLMLSHNCNAHAVRKFKEPHKKDRPKEFVFYYELYQQIYNIEEEAKKEEDPVKLLI